MSFHIHTVGSVVGIPLLTALLYHDISLFSQQKLPDIFTQVKWILSTISC